MAAELASGEIDSESIAITARRDRLITGLIDIIDKTRLNGHPEKRLPGNVNLSFEYVDGATLLSNLDSEGICASTGSACSASNVEPSHVLLAIGLPGNIAHNALRMTLGKWTTDEDIERVIGILPEIVHRIRESAPAYKSIL
jgi:cysteine desulfurase